MTDRNLRSKRRKGFSLIEVLFAIFLVLLCATMVAATMPVATTSRQKADNTNKAMDLAQKQLEAIRTLGYANATNTQLASAGLIDSASPIGTNTYSFSNVDNAALDNPSRVLPNGQGKVILEQPDIDLRRVTVTVSWTELSKTRTFTIGTLIANL